MIVPWSQPSASCLSCRSHPLAVSHLSISADALQDLFDMLLKQPTVPSPSVPLCRLLFFQFHEVFLLRANMLWLMLPFSSCQGQVQHNSSFNKDWVKLVCFYKLFNFYSVVCFELYFVEVFFLYYYIVILCNLITFLYLGPLNFSFFNRTPFFVSDFMALITQLVERHVILSLGS